MRNCPPSHPSISIQYYTTTVFFIFCSCECSSQGWNWCCSSLQEHSHHFVIPFESPILLCIYNGWQNMSKAHTVWSIEIKLLFSSSSAFDGGIKGHIVRFFLRKIGSFDYIMQMNELHYWVFGDWAKIVIDFSLLLTMMAKHSGSWWMHMDAAERYNLETIIFLSPIFYSSTTSEDY